MEGAAHSTRAMPSATVQLNLEKLVQLIITLPVLYLFTHDVFMTIAFIHVEKTTCIVTNSLRAFILFMCVGFIANMWIKTLIILASSEDNGNIIHINNYNIQKKEEENKEKNEEEKEENQAGDSEDKGADAPFDEIR